MSPLDVPKPGPPRRGKSAGFLLVLAALLDVALGVGALCYVACSDIGADEVEHAHVTWALTQGIMPYRDIHQIHTPAVWLVCWPIMKWLPATVETMTAVRGACLLAFVGTFVVGLLVLREVLGPITRFHALVMLLLSLSVFADFQFHRYRPDPFMSLFAALAVLAAVRLGRAPLLHSVMSGMALGLAACFSPKMAPLCLLVPVLCLLESWRSRSLRPLWLVIPNGLGFVVGIVPMVAWILSCGLFGPFVDWTITSNSHTLNFNWGEALGILVVVPVFMAFAVFGGLLVACTKAGTAKAPWPPRNGLLVGASLAWLILIIEPNHSLYNLEAFAMPAAVLGTALIVKTAESDASPWAQRFALVGTALLLVAAKPAVKAIHSVEPGWTISRSDLQDLTDLCRSDDARCVGFAPWHPIFCRDATDVYLYWDIRYAALPWVSATAKRRYLEMLPRAISTIERGEPTLIVDHETWSMACQEQFISEAQYGRFLRAVKARYEPVRAGRVTAFVRKGPPDLGPSEDRPP
jgi:hypothetical protein